MEGLPYRLWFEYYQKFFPSPCAQYVVELFSGPGEIAGIARDEGYRTLALDRHLPFLDGHSAVCANAAELPFRAATLSAAIAANCSINYLRPHNLPKHLGEVFRTLEFGGIYGFEVCGETRAMAVSGQKQTIPKVGVRFEHEYRRNLKILESTVYLPDGRREVHPQYIFGEKEMVDWALKAGFELLEKTENYGHAAGSLPPIDTFVFRVPRQKP